MKYAIDPSLRAFARLPLPLSRGILPIANLIIHLLPKGLREKRLAHERIVQEHWTMHIFSPKELEGQELPCLYYLHGGGFVFQADPHHYRMMKEYALQASCKVILIDYRLAPRYPHPLPLQDCLEGYQYVCSHLKTLGIDPTRILVGGDSAGGFLALEVVRLVQEKHLLSPVGLMLFHPVVDPTMSTASMRRYVDTPLWNARHNQKMWKWYLHGAQLDSPLVYAPQLSIPSIYLEVVEFDCLRDEGIALQQAFKPSTRVEFHEVLGAYHGYDTVQDSPLTDTAMQRRLKFLIDCFSPHS